MRAATKDDLASIAEIYAHYVTTSLSTFELQPPDHPEWERRFAAITGAALPFLVAECAGIVAGYAYCGRWKPRPAYEHTVEDSIYLAPQATGKGIGGTLLDTLLDACADRGIREVIAVIADSGDDASLRLHRGRGFTEAGRLRGVGLKHGHLVDTLLLQRSLG
ncbi:phosphinothricin acetyltransferase [Prauserella marina]|uniref:Phosphinothricin acetyltransferase n=1 Tax=Prauserella marina TaxID=530584 RepID=A0A1G6SG80_9PSEU|nr:phosphinothricin acetyltransferase [Prauserella marina]SDD15930.1 phosphinothricin acetyltransferase [Prauserella marina]